MAVISKNVNETLAGMLDELKEECDVYAELLKRLEQENLSQDQIDELLGEIIGSVTHLHVHSKYLLEELEKD